MPNHVMNVVTFNGNNKKLQEILEDIKALSKMRNNVFKNSNFYNCKLKNQVVLLREFNENNDITD